VDIEQIRKGLAVFGVGPWENRLPVYVDGAFFDEHQTDMWGWDLRKKEELCAVDNDRR
jgi:hypothetical protein